MTLIAAGAYFYPEKFLCVDSGKVSADVIVVLGGGSHERPLRAAELFKQRAAPRIILTGLGDDQISRRSFCWRQRFPLEPSRSKVNPPPRSENAVSSPSSAPARGAPSTA